MAWHIRELQNFIERAVVFTSGDVLELPPLPSLILTTRDPVTLRESERHRLLKALEATKSVVGGPFDSDDNIACANGCRNWNFDDDRLLVRPLFTEENKDANSTSQHATVEYHLAKAL
jgi:DNA-binding NtrC family response regulator